jgi:predicted RNase H-like HicB family nuclease
VALGFTLEETKTLIREALRSHIAAMRADSDEIPEPSYVEMMEVA